MLTGGSHARLRLARLGPLTNLWEEQASYHVRVNDGKADFTQETGSGLTAVRFRAGSRCLLEDDAVEA